MYTKNLNNHADMQIWTLSVKIELITKSLKKHTYTKLKE